MEALPAAPGQQGNLDTTGHDIIDLAKPQPINPAVVVWAAQMTEIAQQRDKYVGMIGEALQAHPESATWVKGAVEDVFKAHPEVPIWIADALARRMAR